MTFHVFLSHNSEDKPTVKRLGTELKKRGLNVWLDAWELRPGLTWQDALEDIIQTCGSAAVCVADNGIGPWEDPEMNALLRRFISEKKAGNILPVIPVLLPGAPANIKLPMFLEAFTWVDLRGGLTSEGLDRLQWGITGINPGSNSGQSSTPPQSISLQQTPETATAGTLVGREKRNYQPSDGADGDVAEEADPEELLPRVVRFLRDLPESDPELYEAIVTALCQETPELEKRKREGHHIDLMDVVWGEGVNNVLEALYRWLDRPARPQIRVEGWQEVLTHLVVLAAASPDWLRQAREQVKERGLVPVAKGLQPLSAAVLISGLFDVAIRLEGSKPTGYISVGRGRGSKGHAAEDRYQDLKTYLQNEYRKYLSPETDSLDEQGMKEMLLSDHGHNNPRFVCLPGDDALAGLISERLGGLVTVLQEYDTAPRVLDQSLRLVKNIQELLDKLQQAP